MQQTWAKWTAFKDKVKNKPKALVSCRKKGKKIRTIGIVRKSHKFNRKLIRKILQRVTKSGKKTESHKKVTEYSIAVVINFLDENSLEKKIKYFCISFNIYVFLKVPSQNDGENGELVDNDVKKFLKKFSLDKLNISPQEQADSHAPIDPSLWDPEDTLVSVDRHSRQGPSGSERFVPCQDCYIDLDLFL